MAGKELVKKVLEVYDMTLPELARYLEHPKTTMQTWIDNDKVPRCGETMLNLLIENKKLKERVEVVERFFTAFGRSAK